MTAILLLVGIVVGFSVVAGLIYGVVCIFTGKKP